MVTIEDLAINNNPTTDSRTENKPKNDLGIPRRST
jgi:hypothetical protein